MATRLNVNISNGGRDVAAAIDVHHLDHAMRKTHRLGHDLRLNSSLLEDGAGKPVVTTIDSSHLPLKTSDARID